MTSRIQLLRGPAPQTGRSASADRGLSLPEFIVAIFLFGIVSTLVVTFYSTITRNFTEDRAATDSTMVASMGMKELTRVLRSGTEIPVSGVTQNKPVFVSANDAEVVLHSYLDTDAVSPKPLMVRFSIDSVTMVLTESRWDASAVSGHWIFPASTTAPVTSRPIARKIVPPASGDAKLFTYYDAAGVALATPVSAANLGNVAAVKVTLKVQADESGRANPVLLQNTVGIPNLGISRVGP